MFIADLALLVAMLVILSRAAGTMYVNYRRANSDAHLPARDIVALLLVLAVSSIVGVWRDPDSTGGWLLLGFNAFAFPTSLFIAQRRARSRMSVSTES